MNDWLDERKVTIRPLNGGRDTVFQIQAVSWNALSFSSDGKLIAVRIQGGALFIGDPATGRAVREFKPKDYLAGSGAFVRPLSFAPDNRTVVTFRRVYEGALSATTVQVLDVPNGTVREFKTDAPLENGVEISKDGKRLLTLRKDRNLQSWDIASGRETAVAGHNWPVNYVDITPDGKTAATAGTDGTVRIWNAVSGEEQHVIKTAGNPCGVAFFEAGKMLAAADSTGEVYMIDTATRKTVKQFTAHKGGVTALALSPDAAWLATGGSDSAIRIWNCSDCKLHRELLGHTGWIHGIRFVDRGRQLLTTSSGGMYFPQGKSPEGDPYFRLWTVATGQPVPGFAEKKIRASSAVVVTPDGIRGLSYIGPEKVGVMPYWEIATGRIIEEVDDNLDGARKVPRAFSPDGSRLFAVSGYTGAGGGATVHVLDARTWKSAAVLKGHFDWVNGAAFSADGQSLITGSEDGRAIVWKMPKPVPDP